jgi:hypothetical protein
MPTVLFAKMPMKPENIFLRRRELREDFMLPA